MKSFNARKGFGFISHAFEQGDLVKFTIERHPGGLRAVDVHAA